MPNNRIHRDNRRHMRDPVAWRTRPGDGLRRGRMRNISDTGVALEVPGDPPTPGSVVRFMVRNSPRERRAIVVRHMRSPDDFVILGCRWTR